MGAHVVDLSLVQDHDPVRVHDGVEPLGDDDLGGLGAGVFEGLPDGRVGGGVHGAGGVVQDEDLGVLEQGPGDAQPLLLPAGHVHAPLAQVRVVTLGEGLDEIVGAGGLAGGFDLVIGGVGIAPLQVLFDGAGEEHVLLQHHADGAPEGVGGIVLHVHAAHLHGPGVHLIEPGDQLDQAGFAAAGAADDADDLAASDVQVDVRQGGVLVAAGVGEVHMVKVHGAVLHLQGGGPVLVDGGDLVQHLHQTLGGGGGHDEHHEVHAEHHEGDEDGADVGDEADELAGEHLARGDMAAADAHHRQDAGVHGQGHEGAAEDQQLFRPQLGVPHVRGALLELLCLIVSPDEGLHHPDGDQILLGGGVHVVIPVEHGDEPGMGLGADEDQKPGQHRQGRQQHQGKPAGDADGHEGGQYELGRGAHGHADGHLKGLLDVGDVVGHAGDEGRGGELIRVLEGEVLHRAEDRVLQVHGEARGGPGAEDDPQHAQEHGPQGEQDHDAAHTVYVPRVPQADAVVDEQGHVPGNEHLEDHLADHAQDGKDGRVLILAHVAQKSLYGVLHFFSFRFSASIREAKTWLGSTSRPPKLSIILSRTREKTASSPSPMPAKVRSFTRLSMAHFS